MFLKCYLCVLIYIHTYIYIFTFLCSNFKIAYYKGYFSEYDVNEWFYYRSLRSATNPFFLK